MRKLFLHKRSLLLAFSTLCLQGCSPALWQGVAAGLAAGSASAPAATNATKLMVFGGSGHQTYLGCLSCSEYSTESLFNQFGTHGSSYSSESVLNHFSAFGSQFAAFSACNPYASDPPVIVDQRGHYYGRLTVNQTRSDGPPTPELREWLAMVCAA